MPKKGGYLSWNPMNWFKSKPEETTLGISEPSTETPTPSVGPYGGRKRTRKAGKARKTRRSRSGRKTNRA